MSSREQILRSIRRHSIPDFERPEMSESWIQYKDRQQQFATVLESVGGQAKRVADLAALQEDLIEVVVQVNGKLRGRISVAADADSDAVGEQALADPNVQRFVGDKVIQKTIVVPGRLVNIVV